MKTAAVGTVSASAGFSALTAGPRESYGWSPNGRKRISYRNLGSTGFRASTVGFGSMNTRNGDLIHAAIDNGINYIDTANSYMRGENERIVGSVMKTKRDKVFLTTKIKWDKYGIAAKDMPKLIEDSLKRLQTDHVDLLLLHVTDSREEILREDHLKIFDDARQKGQTRFVGISTHANQAVAIDAAIESEFWEAVLVGYSYATPKSVQDAIARAHEKGLATIGMKNLLKISQRPRPPITEVPKYDIKGINQQQALLKWVIDDVNLDTTIPGITTFEQLMNDIAVMSMPTRFGNRPMPKRYGGNLKGTFCKGTAGCTGCDKKCPYGVDIREINRCLGYAYGYEDMELAHENYEALPESSKIAACANCDECLVKCENGLDLTQSVRRARELFA